MLTDRVIFALFRLESADISLSYYFHYSKYLKTTFTGIVGSI